MATKNIEIQDDTGNIYYPHTSASVVKCSDGNSVESRLAETAKQLVKTSPTEHTHSGIYEPVLPIERKRKITSGTAIPTGGADGDIYFQYE